nr:hypothetical protein [Tanacetum cinerariifolium]
MREAATTKVKSVNEEKQIQALVDKKKVITETSERSELHLEDAEGTERLPTAIIFKQLTLMSQVKGILKHKKIYVTPSHTKKIFANMKRQGKDFSDEHVTATSNDLLLSSDDRLKLTKLMELYTQLQSRVLALKTTKADQALKIRSLKRRVKKLEKKASKKTHKLKRLYKIGSLTRMESSEDPGLGDQEDASKQRRIIEDLDANEGVALVDETQGRNDQDMFDISILDNEEVVAKKEVSSVDSVTTAGEVVTTVGVKVSTDVITSQISMDEVTLAKALIDIKTSKPKAKGIVIQEQRGLKDQIMIDEEVARKLKAEMQAELEEEERLVRQKEEETNIALVVEWDNTQAMTDADYELATRLQKEKRDELTIEESQCCL